MSTLRLASASPLKAVTAIGTSCNRSDWRRAVTRISPSVVVASGVAALVPVVSGAVGVVWDWAATGRMAISAAPASSRAIDGVDMISLI
ncbi:hypothetical protein QH494_26410 [Sphingomonas sp. AR_OL41]|uniref:hypothetical protein n=1 Tax=Sphingomonas sp. AR_OL41 TaxID=3042729 RepID=UPI00248146C5|nr:hypothetical protein [Sphingomonas sp. AR_OL41]MDH7975735.1 hypothetical protein [Sphingomonas sp. AR_OL41]